MLGLGYQRVGASAELDRIKLLPKRSTYTNLAQELTTALRYPNGTRELWPAQAIALTELAYKGGLFAPIGVGGGKTDITFLAPFVTDSQRPLLLIPAKLRWKTKLDFIELNRHWKANKLPIILSYEMLGRAQSIDALESINPDLIICDECHKLKNVRAAVTRRVGRFMDKNPGTSFAALSGTITKRSLLDFAHIMEWCLQDDSPIPLQVYDLDCWSRALDEKSKWGTERMHPGSILELEPDIEPQAPKGRMESEFSLARRKYRSRMVSTVGVVATKQSQVDASIYITPWQPKNYTKTSGIRAAFKRLRELWETPDGYELTQAVDVWRHARELAQGFYYSWYPKPPEEWLEVRRRWSAIVRGILSSSRTLDSELQVVQKHSKHPAYLEWLAIKPLYEPKTLANWIDYSVLNGVQSWAKDHPTGIIWVEHTAVGRALTGRQLPYYGAHGLNKQGQPIEGAMDRKEGAIVASIGANSEGRNLQKYTHNLVLSPPPNGDIWEQMIGRTHRSGQRADTVSVEVFFGCREAYEGFGQALSDARYQQEVTGSPQKLLLADIDFGQKPEPKPEQKQEQEHGTI